MSPVRAHICCLILTLLAAPAWTVTHAIVVQGLGGDAVYERQFDQEVAAVRSALASASGQAPAVIAGTTTARAQLQQELRKLQKACGEDDLLLVYLAGHGSYDGESYKFNVAGADVGGRELINWLDAVPICKQLLIVTGSASGALQNIAKSPRRLVITGTRSGGERNATRFGSQFSQALSSEEADKDKGGSISATEAFELGLRRVNDFYTAEARLATEHPQSSGGALGQITLARIAVAGQESAAPAAADSPERLRLLERIEALRARKTSMEAAAYDAQLSELLLELATLDLGAEAAAP